MDFGRGVGRHGQSPCAGGDGVHPAKGATGPQQGIYAHRVVRAGAVLGRHRGIPVGHRRAIAEGGKRCGRGGAATGLPGMTSRARANAAAAMPARATRRRNWGVCAASTADLPLSVAV